MKNLAIIGHDNIIVYICFLVKLIYYNTIMYWIRRTYESTTIVKIINCNMLES